jgi:hypothetical protein
MVSKRVPKVCVVRAQVCPEKTKSVRPLLRKLLVINVLWQASLARQLHTLEPIPKPPPRSYAARVGAP